MVQVRENYSEAIRKLGAFHSDQIPYAVALALTRTAQDAQKAIRGEMPQRFTLRNAWSQQGIIIIPASKSKRLVSSVLVGDLWDYLKPQEGGGLKVPLGGRKYLAIPTLAARGGSNSGIIAKAQRPRQLLSNKNSGAFILNSKNGTPLIVRRVGRGGQIVVLYVLVKSGRIKDRLGLIKTGQETAAKVWDTNLAKAIEEALRTAR